MWETGYRSEGTARGYESQEYWGGGMGIEAGA